MKLSEIKKITRADSAGKCKDGTIKLRRGYFYKHGMTAEKYKNSVIERLFEAGADSIHVADFGDHWAPFRGGASVAQNSHFYVNIKIID